jgi:hypothetical protein
MALQSTPTLRWSVFGGMAAVLLGGVALAFWPFFMASRQMDAFCSAQVAGTPLDQVQTQAAALGYGVAPAASGAVLVDDPDSFGRRQCTLALDGQGRVAAPR